MDNLKLKAEQVELKSKLLKLVDFIGSEEYYKLSPNKKKMLENRKIAMEMYLKVLTMEIYEDIDNITVPDMALLGLMGSMFSSSSIFPSSIDSNVKLTEEDFKPMKDE